VAYQFAAKGAVSAILKIAVADAEHDSVVAVEKAL
jgi:hypothetical protein